MEIALENAPHWLNHSHVLIKGPMLAEDEAAITNSIVSVQGAGTANVSVETRAGDQVLAKVARMVTSGVVAVMLRGGAKYEVHLPGETGKLLPIDIAYISAQIDEISKPMSAEEQTAFLNSQSVHVEEHLTGVK